MYWDRISHHHCLTPDMTMILWWRSWWYVIGMFMVVTIPVVASYQPTIITTSTTITNRCRLRSTKNIHQLEDVENRYNPRNNFGDGVLLPPPRLPPPTPLPLSRRSLLQHIMIGISCFNIGATDVCYAAAAVTEESSSSSSLSEPINDSTTTTTIPYATSVQALIPAIRVRKNIDQSIQLTNEIMRWQQQQHQQKLTTNNTTQQDPEIATLLFQLQQLLLSPQNFTSNGMTTSAKSDDVVVVVGSSSTDIAKSYRDRYQENRSPLAIWSQPGAFLVQRGEIATWQRLRQQEQILEQQDEIRAALNCYMNQIQYSTSQYTLTVPNDQRKQMIRTDTLPDVLQQVVPSDMDLRTLYRNMILTSMQEARAELQYQWSRNNEWDGNELLLLLRQAQAATHDWFQMIDPNEIRRAEQQLEEDEEERESKRQLSD